MREHPPFRLKEVSLYWLCFMVTHFNDGDALAELAWQAAIAPGGVNEVAP